MVTLLIWEYTLKTAALRQYDTISGQLKHILTEKGSRLNLASHFNTLRSTEII